MFKWLGRLRCDVSAQEIEPPSVVVSPTPEEYLNRDFPPLCSEFNSSGEVETARTAWVQYQNEKRRAEQQPELDKLITQDNIDREAAQTFKPNVKIVRYAAGDFLVYEGQEYPRNFIESIVITNPGVEPQVVQLHWTMRFPGTFAAGLVPASITMRLCSGTEIVITCNRWNVDILHKALIHAWKHGEPD